MSLRVRLVAAVMVLATAGLTVAGVATYAALRSFLLARMDEQLTRAMPLLELTFRRSLTDEVPVQRPTDLPVGTYAELRTGGQVTNQVGVTVLGETPTQRPELPSDLPFGNSDVAWFTVERDGDVPAYRVRAERSPAGTVEIVVAAPLDQVSSTLRRLVVIEVVVLGSVLVILTSLTWWAVGVGLRPLRRIEHTAGVIADGDLSQRVDVTGGGTEVERLGVSFNSMVERIEVAFVEKDHALEEKAASEDKLRRFVADASHELRTPLTSIRAHAELFRRGAADRPEDLALVMRRIEEEAARMGVLVEDLLLLARLDQGRPLERNPVELAVLAADAVADARAVEPDRPIELDLDPGVVVAGDEARLRQVLANLLANARDHTPPGTPVTVRVRGAGDEVLLEVADRGPGLGPEAQERVFERFFRADGSRTRATGGAGLGLSIVAAIAAAHGGRAEVRSVEGEGATFSVRLPSWQVDEADAPLDDLPPPTAPPAGPPAGPPSGPPGPVGGVPVPDDGGRGRALPPPTGLPAR